jgi:hypothetical protein
LRRRPAKPCNGRIGQPPVPHGIEFQYTINTLGRLLDPEQFDQIVIKTGDAGQVTRLRDVARVELGAKNSDVTSLLDGKPSITLAVFQLPGSNALATANSIRAEMDRLKARFPQGVDYKIVYDTTIFVDESIHEVYKTLFEAFVLVFIVVLIFLQDWRATLLPMIDVPVSLADGRLESLALTGETYKLGFTPHLLHETYQQNGRLMVSDLTSELSGSLGLAASLNAGADHGMAQAAHGSAPDIAGKNVANPLSLILSAAMLLAWHGRRNKANSFEAAATAIPSGLLGGQRLRISATRAE